MLPHPPSIEYELNFALGYNYFRAEVVLDKERISVFKVE